MTREEFFMELRQLGLEPTFERTNRARFWRRRDEGGGIWITDLASQSSSARRCQIESIQRAFNPPRSMGWWE